MRRKGCGKGRGKEEGRGRSKGSGDDKGNEGVAKREKECGGLEELKGAKREGNNRKKWRLR